MKTFLTIFQVILAVLVTLLIFLQSQPDTENRNNILSPVVFEKRGWEKVVFSFTIFITFLFLLTSLVLTLL